MLDIVSQLKNNSLSLGSILKDDAAKLEDLETQTGMPPLWEQLAVTLAKAECSCSTR
jgi:hypothetical protein